MNIGNGRLGARVLVVGAGIGGLAAAAAAAPFFDEVTLLDKDELPEGARARKAVPHGHHLHVLLKGGELFLEEILPGIREEFLAAGASELGAAQRIRIFERGHWYPPRDLGFSQLGLSRPVYEHVVRRQLDGLENVTIRDRTSAASLILENGRALGLRTLAREGERVERADLVVMACGRGGGLEGLLSEAGRGPVPATQLGIEVHYATGRFAKPTRFKGEATFLMCVPAPPEVALGFLCPVENDEWLVALGGRFDRRPPTDLEAFRNYASALSVPDIAERVRDATLVEPLRSYRMNSAVWYHYDRYGDLPERLVPLGDSIASFNPTFGQGMTVAAGHAAALRAALSRRSAAGQGLDSLTDDYFPRAIQLTQQAWIGSTTLDLEYAETTGERPAEYDKTLAWFEAMRRAARRHPEVQKLRGEIGNFLKPPTASRESPYAELIAAELAMQPPGGTP